MRRARFLSALLVGLTAAAGTATAQNHAPPSAANHGNRRSPHHGAAAASANPAGTPPAAGAAQSNAGPPPPVSAGGAPGGASPETVWASCIEHVPSGVQRPKMSERFPSRALSGYAVSLEIRIDHGKGEVVLPQGFQVQTGSDAARVLGDAGFLLPDPGGTGAPTVRPSTNGASEGAAGGAKASTPTAQTDVTIPFLVLPKTPGRHVMTLPPVPIAVARASGDVVTLCTQPHTITVEDPIASLPDPKPKPNPAPLVQREEWTLAKQITLAALASAVVAALATWLILRWMRRPRPAPPPPPPRPSWEVALEELGAVRHAGLMAQGRFAEHFDRVSDALRKYLGGRYGFDGLETTTHEMQARLRSLSPPMRELPLVFGLLDTCDLVKFARYTPTEQDGAMVLDEAERVVHTTMPVAPAPPPKEAA